MYLVLTESIEPITNIYKFILIVTLVYTFSLSRVFFQITLEVSVFGYLE